MAKPDLVFITKENEERIKQMSEGHLNVEPT